MMHCKFLDNVDMCKEDLKHGDRLPLHAHLIKVRSHVWILVHGVSVPEVEEKFAGSAVGVS